MNSFNFLKVSFTLSDILCLHFIGPFILKNDKHLISPHNISPESHIKVTKIKESKESMQTDQRLSRFKKKPSNKTIKIKPGIKT